MIRPPATAWRIGRQEHPQALPLLISQIMTIQLIKHHTDLHDPAAKIHGTHPRDHRGIRRCPWRMRCEAGHVEELPLHEVWVAQQPPGGTAADPAVRELGVAELGHGAAGICGVAGLCETFDHE